MKYMGSKRAMLQNGLGAVLDQELKGARRFVDLFAGSGAVSIHVAQRRNIPVVSVDIQTYSVVLTKAVITRDRPFLWESSLNRWIKRATKHRQDILARKPKKVTSKSVFEARALCARSALPITRAYGGHYFSLEQAAWIDSLRRCVPKSEPAKGIALAALIQAASQCAASPGHTAQPFQPTSRAIRFLADAWSRDVVARTRKAFISISGICAQRCGHAEIGDANVVARTLKGGDVVFLDPPYSGVHYSRFYHVLETIARGRCEAVSGVGRYPPPLERPRSSYSVATESKKALSNLLETIASRKARTILTFPAHDCSNGLSGKTVRNLARKYFRLKQQHVKSVFSSLGGIGDVGAGAARRCARLYARECILVLDPK
jgi:adenine-specific DNA methylase